MVAGSGRAWTYGKWRRFHLCTLYGGVRYEASIFSREAGIFVKGQIQKEMDDDRRILFSSPRPGPSFCRESYYGKDSRYGSNIKFPELAFGKI